MFVPLYRREPPKSMHVHPSERWPSERWREGRFDTKEPYYSLVYRLPFDRMWKKGKRDVCTIIYERHDNKLEAPQTLLRITVLFANERKSILRCPRRTISTYRTYSTLVACMADTALCGHAEIIRQIIHTCVRHGSVLAQQKIPGSVKKWKVTV